MLSKLNKKSLHSGFTLLEILLVVGIISILAGIVIVAINPSKQLATVRNTERKNDIKQLNSAVLQFYIDHGYFPASSTPYLTQTGICNSGADTAPDYCGDLINLSELVPTYITSIPTDPQTDTGATSTNYEIVKNSTGKIGFNAAGAELEQGIVIGIATSSVVVDTPPAGLDPNITSLMHMDGANNSTTFTDEVGGEATLNGSVIISTTQSKFGGTSAYFPNNPSSYLLAPTASIQNIGTGPFTIDFWVYPEDASQYKTMLSTRTVDSGSYDELLFLFLDGPYPWFYAPRPTWDGGIAPYTNNTMSLNTWTHVAIVGNGAANGPDRTITLYINGSSDTGLTYNVDYDLGSDPLWIGGDFNAPNFPVQAWSGYIDELRITNDEAWTANFTPPTQAY